VAQGINKPEYQTYALFFEQASRAFFYYAFLNPNWGLITITGAESALLLYCFADFPAFVVKLVTQWLFVKRTIKFSVKPPMWQTFGAPLLTQIPIALLLYIPVTIFKQFATSSTDLVMPVVILGVTLIVGLFLFPGFVLFPFFGYFGGWDEDTLQAFEKAARISGPSKFLVKIMAKTTRWAHEKSPIKDKFRIPFKEAKKEAEELSIDRIRKYLTEKDKD